MVKQIDNFRLRDSGEIRRSVHRKINKKNTYTKADKVAKVVNLHIKTLSSLVRSTRFKTERSELGSDLSSLKRADKFSETEWNELSTYQQLLATKINLLEQRNNLKEERQKDKINQAFLQSKILINELNDSSVVKKLINQSKGNTLNFSIKNLLN